MAGLSGRSIFFATAAAVMVSSLSFADSQRGPMGWDDLVERLGENAPDGAGVLFGQVELRVAGNYLPNPDHRRFQGKSFTAHSGSSGISGHATSVGRHGYGELNSLAPGVTNIHNWETNHWLGSGFLRTGSGQPPLNSITDLYNHSWIGSAGGFDNEMLRRADHVVDVQDVMFIVGVQNGSGPLNQGDHLMGHMFNGLVVGRSDGSHHSGTTRNGLDGPGRMKPDIVAPDSATSWTTGLISGLVATLFETARTLSPGNDAADDSEVIRAVALAGATRRAGWSNNPVQSGNSRGITFTPYDPVFGADQGNINTSHLILTGGEQDGVADDPPLSGSITNAGWDLLTTESGGNNRYYYRFEIREPKDTMSFVAAWNRQVPVSFSTFDNINVDIEIFKVESNGDLTSLRGPAGESVFQTGTNIASLSGVDNVELIFAKDFQPGDYVLEVFRRNDNEGNWNVAVAWFFPPSDAIPAMLSDITMLRGTLISGGIPELTSSDDQYFVTEAEVTGEVAQPHLLQILFGADSVRVDPAAIDITFESRITDIEAHTTLLLRDWIADEFVEVDNFTVGMQESTHVTTVPNADRFVRDSDGRIELELKQINFFPFTLGGYRALMDQLLIATR